MESFTVLKIFFTFVVPVALDIKILHSNLTVQNSRANAGFFEIDHNYKYTFHVRNLVVIYKELCKELSASV